MNGFSDTFSAQEMQQRSKRVEENFLTTFVPLHSQNHSRALKLLRPLSISWLVANWGRRLMTPTWTESADLQYASSAQMLYWDPPC